jgi:hypothetical protein
MVLLFKVIFIAYLNLELIKMVFPIYVINYNEKSEFGSNQG